MKTKILLIITALLFASFTGAAMAEPKNGFSLNAGLANHNRDCNGCAASKTSGLNLGLDYQFALSNNFSINPFLMSSSETFSNSSGTTLGHGILGVQARYWMSDVFVGAHVGSYSEVVANSGVSISGSGVGVGLVAGWEKPDGGLYVMGQYDSATVNYASLAIDQKFTGFRLSVGYRWK